MSQVFFRGVLSLLDKDKQNRQCRGSCVTWLAVIYPQVDQLALLRSPGLGPLSSPPPRLCSLGSVILMLPVQAGLEGQVPRTSSILSPYAALLPDTVPLLGTSSHSPFLGFRSSSVSLVEVTVNFRIL